MIRHIVMFAFLPEAEGRTRAENAAIARGMLEALPQKIDWIRNPAVALRMDGAESANFDLILSADFDSMEDLNRYLVHPDHKAVGEFMRTVRRERACVDFEV